MKIARGEWIYFVDSDDWVDHDAIRKLYQFAVENHCNVVQGGLYYAYYDHLLYRKASKKEQEKTILDRHDAMRELIVNDRVKNFAWGKLYKAELIKDLFFPVGKYFEDSFWQHLVIDRVNRYGIVDEPLYFYRQRQDSISGKLSDKYNDLLDGYNHRLIFIQRNYPELELLIQSKVQEVYSQIHPQNGWTYYFVRFLKRIRGRLTPTKYVKVQL